MNHVPSSMMHPDQLAIDLGTAGALVSEQFPDWGPLPASGRGQPVSVRDTPARALRPLLAVPDKGPVLGQDAVQRPPAKLAQHPRWLCGQREQGVKRSRNLA